MKWARGAGWIDDNEATIQAAQVGEHYLNIERHMALNLLYNVTMTL